ncbi:MAG: response regulator [Gammaproteobacteria bacterium]
MLAGAQLSEKGQGLRMPTPLVMVACADPAISDALRLFLGQHGCRVALFQIGERLLRELPEQRPGLIVIDSEFDDDKGIALLRQILSIDHSLPVVVLGKQGDVAAGVLAMRSGAADFLEKPFFQVALRRNLERALGSATDAEDSTA